MMPITIHLPLALAQFAGFAATHVEAGSVAGALDALDAKHPGVADRIRNELGQPRPHVLIYIDDTEVRELQGLATPLRGGEVLTVVAAVSGG